MILALFLSPGLKKINRISQKQVTDFYSGTEALQSERPSDTGFSLIWEALPFNPPGGGSHGVELKCVP